MGDSAGGNLAAVVCLMARDRGGPPIAFQLLIYPSVDMVNTYPSEDENEFAPILGKADLHAQELYCPGQQGDPYASPLFGKHEGLPPALIQTANHDPLRDQGPAYAAALQAAGVAAQVHNYVDAVHGYISVPGVVPASRQALADAIEALRAAHCRPKGWSARISGNTRLWSSIKHGGTGLWPRHGVGRSSIPIRIVDSGLPTRTYE